MGRGGEPPARAEGPVGHTAGLDDGDPQAHPAAPDPRHARRQAGAVRRLRDAGQLSGGDRGRAPRRARARGGIRRFAHGGVRGHRPGPEAEALLAPLTPVGVAMIPYYHFAEGKVAGVQCFISRTGYTGEDGFELYCRAADAETLWHALVGAGRAEPCGLGARDTLRLEAGYPLYGSDIDAAVTPYEAGLGWIVKLEKGADFTGLAALKRQKLAGVKRRLVGFKVTEPKVVARHGYGVYLDGPPVDVVRSGTVTPTANCAIGMTYPPVAQAKPGTRFTIDVRGKRAPAEVVGMPFVPRRTKK